MDLQQIKKIAEKQRCEFKRLAAAIGMSEGNLHRCVRENKIQAQDLEKISRELNVSILEFFDEDVVRIGALATGKRGTAVGRADTIDQRVMKDCTDANGGESSELAALRRKIESLQEEKDKLHHDLLAAQSKIISLLER